MNRIFVRPRSLLAVAAVLTFLRALLAPLSLLAALPGVILAATILPPEFIDQPIANQLVQPVNFDFLPDGRVLVVERATARIRLARTGGLQAAETVGTVPGVRTSAPDEGVLGIAVDTRWPLQPYLYVHFTSAASPNIKVTRYQVGGDLDNTGDGRLLLVAGSERNILADLPDDNPLHNGGSMVFGKDGRLYIALGDDGVSCSAQDKHQMRGKILRLNIDGVPTGGGPAPTYAQLAAPGNPFILDVDPRARLVWQYGLRNPWTFDIDPVSGVMAIADVGENKWEEIDVTYAGGRNFGWPFLEGDEPFTYTCENPNFSNLTPPSFTYGRDSTGAAITVILGGICYHPPLLPSGFPQEYWGQVFYFDFFDGRLKRLVCDSGLCEPAPPVAQQPEPDAWGLGFAFVPRMRFGPDGALWYLKGAELRRIHHPGVIAVPPPLADLVTRGSLRVYPSPSAGAVTIEYASHGSGGERIEIRDLAGRVTRQLRLAPASGLRRIAWDGYDESGRRVPPGMYFARVQLAGATLSRRILMLGSP